MRKKERKKRQYKEWEEIAERPLGQTGGYSPHKDLN
jgi:hypothetical protein